MTDDELEAIRARKLERLRQRLEGSPTPASRTDGAPIVLTDDAFDEAVAEHPLVLVDFWAAWCAPCRQIAPILDALARDYAEGLVVGKLNVDENPRTAARFGVHSIPTLLFFRNGRPVERVVGAVPRPVLEGTLQKLLAG